MSAPPVSRADLKSACEAENWDLLDKLLELDRALIDDNSLFTDTWGEWWGLLMEVIRRNSEDGLKVLLKHGANRELATWGDGIPHTPAEAAEGKENLLALLQSP